RAERRQKRGPYPLAGRVARHALELQADNMANLLLAQGVEYDDLIDAIEKLGAEVPAQHVHHLGLGLFVLLTCGTARLQAPVKAHKPHRRAHPHAEHGCLWSLDGVKKSASPRCAMTLRRWGWANIEPGAARSNLYQPDNSVRTISAPAASACSLPLATARGKGAMPQLVQGYSLSASTN